MICPPGRIWRRIKARLMRSEGLNVRDGIDQNLISRIQQCLISVPMHSSGQPSDEAGHIYHHRLLRSVHSLCFVRQSLPFAVIGSIAYCSRGYLDSQMMTTSVADNCDLHRFSAQPCISRYVSCCNISSYSCCLSICPAEYSDQKELKSDIPLWT